MTFTIDTDFNTPGYATEQNFNGRRHRILSEGFDGSNIEIADFTTAERTCRKIICAIQNCETPEQVNDYVQAESLMIDALYLFDPDMSASITDAARDQAIWTNPDRLKPRPAEPGKQAIRRNTLEKFNAFKKVMFPDVTFLYPKLDQTYRYNAQEKRSEPCAATVNNAAWSLAWEMSVEDATAIAKELMAHYQAATNHDSKLPKFVAKGEGKTTVFGLKRVEKDDGTTVAQFTAKKRGMTAAGKEGKAPVVVGPDLQPLADKAIWTGSKGSVRVLAFPVTDPDGVGGISLLLDAVQVTEAVYGGDNLEDDFGPAKKPTLDDYQTEAPEHTPAELDDEIAF